MQFYGFFTLVFYFAYNGANRFCTIKAAGSIALIIIVEQYSLKPITVFIVFCINEFVIVPLCRIPKNTFQKFCFFISCFIKQHAGIVKPIYSRYIFLIIVFIIKNIFFAYIL